MRACAGAEAGCVSKGGSGSAMCVAVIQNSGSGARSNPQVRMRREHKMGKCACERQGVVRCGSFTNYALLYVAKGIYRFRRIDIV
eukprot:2494137-Pleurochrysis_carterae.AAC.1